MRSALQWKEKKGRESSDDDVAQTETTIRVIYWGSIWFLVTEFEIVFVFAGGIDDVVVFSDKIIPRCCRSQNPCPCSKSKEPRASRGTKIL